MLALVSPGLPALPDSICLPEEMLVSLTVGQPVRLAEQHLFWEQNELLLQNDESFTGKLSLREGFPAFPRWRRWQPVFPAASIISRPLSALVRTQLFWRVAGRNFSGSAAA